MTDLQAAVRSMAVRAHKMGVCVLPAAEDGSKRPGVPSWIEYQKRRPTDSDMRRMFPTEGGPAGLGYVTGAVSGGLELFEFDDAGAEQEFRAMAAEAGAGDLIERLDRAYSERTPGGGLHWLYRCTEGAGGNTKLAGRGQGRERKTLIETRGEGGWVVVAPSGGSVHPTGKAYEVVRGGPATIPTLTGAERDVLWGLARAMNEATEDRSVSDGARVGQVDGDRPGDRFNAIMTWPEILEPAGWRRLFTRGDETYWNRPGARDKRGIDATTGARGHDYLYVFSTSAEPFETERGYDKLGAHALLNHGGDVGAAVKALAEDRRFNPDLDRPVLEPINLAERPQEPVSSEPGTNTADDAVTAILGDVVQPDTGTVDDFDHAFPPDHFVTRWIKWGLSQTDAAAEYHEAAALVALACAMPDVRTRELSFWPEGLPANLYVLLIGPSSTSRKSTAAGFAVKATREVYPRTVMPDRMSPEAWIEQMSRRSDGPALWRLDEIAKSLGEWGSGKPQGELMLQNLLSAWDALPFTYARHSKRAKGAPEAEDDNDTITKSHLSIIGSATPSIYGVRGIADMAEDGLLPRFSIVYGDHKPPRRRWGVQGEDREHERQELVRYLAQTYRWANMTAEPIVVRSDPGVLTETLDRFDHVMSRAAEAHPILGRIPAMAVKVAMLSAAGHAEPMTGQTLRITQEDAEAAIKVTSRWARNARRFMQEVAAGSHTTTETRLTQVLAFVREHGPVRRGDVMRRFRLQAFDAEQIKDTLEQRRAIEVGTEQGKAGRPAEVWRAL